MGEKNVTSDGPEVGRENAQGSELWAAGGRVGESQGRKLGAQLHAGRGGEEGVR